MTNKLPEAHAKIDQVRIPRNWSRCTIRMPDVSRDMGILMQASGHMVTQRIEGETIVIELMRIRRGDDGNYFRALIGNISRDPGARIEFIEKEPAKRAADKGKNNAAEVPFAIVAHQTRRFLGKILGGAG